MVEARVLEKIRRVLIDDATIKGYVGDRVYAAHISSISNPVFPAISLMILQGAARTDVIDMVNMTVQIDLWFPAAEYTIDEVLACYDRIRTLFHREHLSDTTIGVSIQQIFESIVGPVMFDEGIQGHHLPARYAVVAI